MHHFVGAITTCEGIWFCPEGVTHANDVTHGFLEGIVAFEARIGVDVGVYLHFNVVTVEQRTKFKGGFDGFAHFMEHAFLQREMILGDKGIEIHESTVFFSHKNDCRGEFDDVLLDLGIGSNTDFEFVAVSYFSKYCRFYLVMDGPRNRGAI